MLDLLLLVLFLVELPILLILIVGQIRGQLPRPAFKWGHSFLLSVVFVAVLDVGLTGVTWLGLAKIGAFLGFTYIAMSKTNL